jgi:hypothetical protein
MPATNHYKCNKNRLIAWTSCLFSYCFLLLIIQNRLRSGMSSAQGTIWRFSFKVIQHLINIAAVSNPIFSNKSWNHLGYPMRLRLTSIKDSSFLLIKQLKHEAKINLSEVPTNVCLIKERDKSHMKLKKKKEVLCYYTLLLSAWIQDFRPYKAQQRCQYFYLMRHSVSWPYLKPGCWNRK